jgi:hypothetical protein
MMWVGCKFDKTILEQVVGNALNALSVHAQIAGEPSYRLCTVRVRDRSEDRPTGARQVET